jgi:hypothetical protein
MARNAGAVAVLVNWPPRQEPQLVFEADFPD